MLMVFSDSSKNICLLDSFPEVSTLQSLVAISLLKLET